MTIREKLSERKMSMQNNHQERKYSPERYYWVKPFMIYLAGTVLIVIMAVLRKAFALL